MAFTRGFTVHIVLQLFEIPNEFGVFGYPLVLLLSAGSSSRRDNALLFFIDNNSGNYAYSITITSKLARWCLISPTSRVFTQPFIRAQIKKHQSFASLAFLRGVHRWPLNFPHKAPVTRNMDPFNDVIAPNAIGAITQSRNFDKTLHPVISPGPFTDIYLRIC